MRVERWEKLELGKQKLEICVHPPSLCFRLHPSPLLLRRDKSDFGETSWRGRSASICGSPHPASGHVDSFAPAHSAPWAFALANSFHRIPSGSSLPIRCGEGIMRSLRSFPPLPSYGATSAANDFVCFVCFVVKNLYALAASARASAELR